MSNVSALIDPNETQLPAGVFKFPANEIMESVNVEIDEKYNVEGIEPHSTSPKTPMDILGNRLKEYECLMDDLKASTKQKIEAHQELIRLKQENAETATLKTRLAETNVILEDLRIKHGNEKEKLIEAKERLRESMKENLALKTIKARKKEAEKGLEQLCMNYQEEIEKLKTKVADQQIMEEMKNKVEKYRNQIEQFQNEAIYWKTEAEKQANGSQHKVEYLQDEIKQMTNQVQQLENELTYWRTAKSNVNDEIEQLKRQLRDAEATVARYRSRQEKVDKKLRSELAKTHNVLKKTKANLNECKEQVPS
jgi:chromosome segregation ATPase